MLSITSRLELLVEISDAFRRLRWYSHNHQEGLSTRL